MKRSPANMNPGSMVYVVMREETAEIDGGER